MAKSYLYVPGLAQTELVTSQAKAGAAFAKKVADAFPGDPYVIDMVATLQNKGAIATDCRQSLRWIEIPVPAGQADALHPTGPAGAAAAPAAANHRHKAFKVLGLPKDNVLALQPGGSMTPPVLSLGVDLVPCTAPQYMAQPMSSSARTRALAGIAKGDTLYIVGHANAMGGSLMYKCPALGHEVSVRGGPGCQGWEHSEKRHIDPVTLASLLINEGLPEGISFDIAVVACFSGGLDNPDWQTVQPYAQRLAGTLTARKYPCRVYGATGLTSSTGKVDVQVARKAVQKPDGTVQLAPLDKERLPDEKGNPFYKRFFRFFKG